MTDPILTLTSIEQTRVERRTERALESLRRFARAEFATVPSRLRAPHSRSVWANRMTDHERLAHLGERVAEQMRNEVLAERREREARVSQAREPSPSAALAQAGSRPAQPKTEPQSVATAATEIVSDLVPGRYWTPCAGGCGTLIPSRSARPSIVFCTPHGAQRVYTKRRRLDVLAEPGRQAKRARARAVCSHTATE
jgi:hypothetical protein